MTDAAGFALWRTGSIEPSQWNGQAKSNCCGFRENGRREIARSIDIKKTKFYIKSDKQYVTSLK